MESSEVVQLLLSMNEKKETLLSEQSPFSGSQNASTQQSSGTIQTNTNSQIVLSGSIELPEKLQAEESHNEPSPQSLNPESLVSAEEILNDRSSALLSIGIPSHEENPFTSPEDQSSTIRFRASQGVLQEKQMQNLDSQTPAQADQNHRLDGISIPSDEASLAMNQNQPPSYQDNQYLEGYSHLQTKSVPHILPQRQRQKVIDGHEQVGGQNLAPNPAPILVSQPHIDSTTDMSPLDMSIPPQNTTTHSVVINGHMYGNHAYPGLMSHHGDVSEVDHEVTASLITMLSQGQSIEGFGATQVRPFGDNPYPVVAQEDDSNDSRDSPNLTKRILDANTSFSDTRSPPGQTSSPSTRTKGSKGMDAKRMKRGDPFQTSLPQTPLPPTDNATPNISFTEVTVFNQPRWQSATPTLVLPNCTTMTTIDHKGTRMNVSLVAHRTHSPVPRDSLLPEFPCGPTILTNEHEPFTLIVEGENGRHIPSHIEGVISVIDSYNRLVPRGVRYESQGFDRVEMCRSTNVLEKRIGAFKTSCAHYGVDVGSMDQSHGGFLFFTVHLIDRESQATLAQLTLPPMWVMSKAPACRFQPHNVFCQIVERHGVWTRSWSQILGSKTYGGRNVNGKLQVRSTIVSCGPVSKVTHEKYHEIKNSLQIISPSQSNIFDFTLSPTPAINTQAYPPATSATFLVENSSNQTIQIMSERSGSSGRVRVGDGAKKE